MMFSLACGALFAERPISEFTEKKVEEFVTYRVVLKSEDVDIALKKMAEIRDSVLPELPKYAKDFEQETCILETMYFMEMYERQLASEGNQRELRARMKSLALRNIKCIDARKKEDVSDWMYVFSGDSTSYYMTRSLAATLRYGFKVKGFYEKAIELNKNRASAHVSLGNWCFYAPSFAGGGKRKAREEFEKSIECATIPGEQYLAYIAYSQLNYEENHKAIASEYLEKAVNLGLGRKALDVILKCNEKGYSHFQYLRNRSGIDEEMAEDEKDEDDKK